jgi:hypothetical protein
VIEVLGKEQTRVRPEGTGFRVQGADGEPAGSLSAVDGGFVLVDEAGSEIGRTSAIVGAREAGTRFLLLEDGRLFRIGLRRPREGVFELSSWEAPGAYLEAHPRPGGWELSPTVAGGCLPDIRVLCVLLAAELLAAEEALQDPA